MELLITSNNTTLYSGVLDIKEVGKTILNPTNLQKVQTVCKDNLLIYEYNPETSNNKVREISQFLGSIKVLLSYGSIEGRINKELEKASGTRTTDLSEKITQCIPNAPNNTKELIESKINKIFEIMAEINEVFRNPNFKPTSLPKDESYEIRHHFKSPDTLAKSKTK